MENLYKFIVAIGGATASYLFGGWSALLNVLVIFVVIDYVTGWLAARANGKLSSKVGFWGITKKVVIFLIVAIAHQIDTTLGDAHFIRDATIFFYLANELLSIIENAGRLGVPIPSVIKQSVEMLNEKGEKGGKGQ